jgi:RNA polymerase sigma-B factor
MGSSDSSTLSSFTFPARSDAPSAARRALHSVARLDPIRLAEAQVMVTELMANALQHGGLTESCEIHMRVDRDPARVRVVISHLSRAGIDTVDAGMGFTLLERLARKWEFTSHGGVFEVWFEVRAAGTGEAILDLADDEVLARAKTDALFIDEAVRRFRSLATGLAHRFRGKGVGDGDLEQVALVGLLDAITRYEAEKGPFRPFAIITIQGVLKRQLRDRAWSVRVPRGLQERSLLVAKTTQSLSQTVGRAVTARDVAAELDLSEDEVVEAIAANSAYQWQSIDAPHEVTGHTLAEALHDRDWATRSGEWEALAEGIQALSPREQELLYLRFYRDLTQSEIADAMGISQMHVSRLLSRATNRLRHLVE